ncbi:hypothetical protein ACH3XW_14865 [Acanthocheilonema viteae]
MPRQRSLNPWKLSSLSIHFPSRHFRQYCAYPLAPGTSRGLIYQLYKRTHQRNLNPMNEEHYPFPRK